MTETSEREVSLAALLTITTGVLLTDMDDAWSSMDFLYGRLLMTHERPDASGALEPLIFARFPRLAEAQPPPLKGEVECRAWVAEVAEHVGWDAVTLPPLREASA